jgi:hypothetical protein
MLKIMRIKVDPNERNKPTLATKSNLGININLLRFDIFNTIYVLDTLELVKDYKMIKSENNCPVNMNDDIPKGVHVSVLNLLIHIIETSIVKELKKGFGNEDL